MARALLPQDARASTRGKTSKASGSLATASTTFDTPNELLRALGGTQTGGESCGL